MEIQRNRPVITDEDHPETLIEVLRWSWSQAGSSSLGIYDVLHWQHGAQNSSETLEDEFRSIDGENIRPEPREAVLWDQSPNTLELALVGYGAENIQDDEIVGRVDELLVSIDGIKGQVK